MVNKVCVGPYDYFANFSKNIAHQAIECTFPRTAAIALVSAGAGWYAHEYMITYSQGYTAKVIESQFDSIIPGAGWFIGHFSAPLVVPTTSPYLAKQVSLAVYLSTSLTLNLLAQLFFGIKKKDGQPDLLPDALKGIGIDIDQVAATPPCGQETQAAAISAAQAKRLSPATEALDTPPSATVQPTRQPPAENLLNPKSMETENAPDTSSALSCSGDQSDLFGDEDPVQKGCCAWRICI